MEKTQKYIPSQIEPKWEKKWNEAKIYSPDLDLPVSKADKAKRPFYNLMMFPYPSAEGMHVGNMYAFTGSDIYGRFKRMQGFDVFEPIGLDGFGIHSENYAIKVGRHPTEQAKISEKNFYRQLKATGNGFDWTRTVQTYDPNYYKWTQWIFTQLFKAGLAYRKKSPVNFCPSCKTVLADEQVIDNKCERCSSVVEKRELEQWFFKITTYADRLLNNIEKLDWTDKVKIAQRNWIGKKEGALISFPIHYSKHNFVLLHGFGSHPERDFHPWLRKQLEKKGYKVFQPALPNSENPTEEEQVEYVLESAHLDQHTVLFGHSLGAVVALKVAEKLKTKITGLVLAAGFIEPTFHDHKRPFEATFKWDFDFEKIKSNVAFIKILSAKNDSAVPAQQGKILSEKLFGKLIEVEAASDHFTGQEEPVILNNIIPSLDAFTTRPDTLYGATFMVISPEHPLAQEIVSGRLPVRKDVSQSVKKYIKDAQKMSQVERTSEQREKTGVDTGFFVLHPITGEKLPIWIADYVLMDYGTGAIMGVPAHDQRDLEFALKYKLPVKEVVTQSNAKIQKVKDKAYVGEGKIVNSGEWNNWSYPNDIGRVIDWLEKRGIGQKKVTYHLRDWLISRQRYWGPPIPMLFCSTCADKSDSWFTTDEVESHHREISNNPSARAQGEGKFQMSNKREIGNWKLEIGNSAHWAVGWYPVSEKDLPVILPFVKDWKPLGTGKSPLASVESFVKAKCPNCKGPADRETDVSDTFLDSSWYFFRYLFTEYEDIPFGAEKFVSRSTDYGLQTTGKSAVDRRLKAVDRARNWLPVTMYIGGAEHAVLHLLYSRFLTMFFKDLGLIQFEEPFARFYAHGLLIKEGAKMSKSKGNVVVPDQYISKYGADTLRTYLMFIGPFNMGGDFYDSGIEGVHRFLKRVWTLIIQNQQSAISNQPSEDETRMMHKTIKRVTQDLEKLHYNTAISALMEFYNFLSKQKSVSRESVEAFLKLLAPFAPHMSEELWSRLQSMDYSLQKKKPAVDGRRSTVDWSIHTQAWPVYDEKFLQEKETTIVAQVNGRIRATIRVQSSEFRVQNLVEQEAKKQNNVKKYLNDKKIKKVIYIPGKIINFVIE